MNKPLLKCWRCEESIKGNRCKCGAWTWEQHLSDGRNQLIDWEDVSDKALQRISLGVLDDCLCGGVVRSDVVLLAGEPGVGKSTLLLQIAERIWQHGPCLYVAAEEDIPTIKARGKRLGVRPNRGQLVFCNAMGGADLGQDLIDAKPAGFIIDSGNAVAGGDLNAEIRLLETLKKFCVQLQAPALVISQVNAANDFSGLMAKRHAVDVLLRLTKSEQSNETGEPFRILESSDKNRNGRIGIETVLEMTERGLVPV